MLLILSSMVRVRRRERLARHCKKLSTMEVVSDRLSTKVPSYLIVIDLL